MFFLKNRVVLTNRLEEKGITRKQTKFIAIKGINKIAITKDQSQQAEKETVLQRGDGPI